MAEFLAVERWFTPSKVAKLIFILWISDVIICQITPPPPINDSPVIANDRIYYLKTFPARCGPPLIDTFPGGFVIRDSRAMMRNNSPHIIRGNIEIAPNACLYIEPGSVLKFAPGIGIIVNGTLIARGSELPGGRITMTKLNGEDIKKPSGGWQDDARLVMGNTTRDGRLDLKYMSRWRAICTNYNNFTAIDANVTCRHLGFLKGNFTYHSFARNLTDYILWERPACTGVENNLFDCPGANTMKIGRHICDGQEVIGFQCEGLKPGLALDHWRGLDFYNSTTEARFQIQNNTKVYMNESLSFLEYLDISYAGLDVFHGKTIEPDIFYPKATISASPFVPRMNNVTVRYGAYDALNLTEVISPILIANSTISYNRGYGMFIQSSVGRCLVNMTEVDHNWGDGVKFYLSNLTIFDFRMKFPPSRSFCAQAMTQDVTFPFYQHMDLVQVNGNDRTMTSVSGSCERIFATAPNMKITVHFMIMERDPDATGDLIFRDSNNLGRVLATVPVYNGTFPQSITTMSNAIHVRFQYTQPKDLICKQLPSCIRFLLEFTSGFDVEEEFRLIMSNVHDNIGYGVNIQDMRSRVRISNETIIASNRFGAGLLVYKGAGDIIINGTRFEKNADAGVNITYSGGYQLINSTQFIANKGYGIITEYMRLNRTRFESQHKVEFVKTRFLWNELIGLRMGNYCSSGDVLINESYFAYNYDDALEYLSCNISTMFKRKFTLKFNTFTGNFRYAIIMRPLLNTDGLISNNTFSNHSLGAIRVDNGYDLLISRWYRDFPVTFNIFENKFTNNMGRYVVNFRLTQNSAVQNLTCKFNYFQDNDINNSFPFLNPRGRANAVIVLSSSNIQFRRNYIDNPASVREVATHLVDPSVTIDATENYWGTEINRQADYEKVYNSIFDQDDRYNLGQIEYHPALRSSRLYEDYTSYDIPKYVWQFQRGNVIGGILENSFFTGQGKTYYVDKDIYIFPDKTLFLDSGTKLKFMPSVGILVHGVLRADGSKRETTLNFDMDDREEFVPMENRTASVRLMNGYDEFEGRLEVEINGTWGTVCKDGWIVENSLLACQQLGLVYNPDYPAARMQIPAASNVSILMSWVSCEDVDVDLTQCRALNMDAASCDHSKDVFLRCQKPTWAGITLAAADRSDQIQPDQSDSQIRFVELNNAGLLDPDTGETTPALRIDYNYYQISWLTIQNCMSDGILISYNKPYSLNKLEYVTVLNSARNGIVTKSPVLEVMHSRFDANQMAGFLYNPFFTEYDALLIRNTIYPSRRVPMFGQPRLTLKDGQKRYLICSAGQTIERKEYIVELQAASLYSKIVVQVLDYLPVESAEKVIIYDSDKTQIGSPSIRRWEIEKDLVDFPILSNAGIITIQLKVNGQLSGRLAFAVFTQELSAVDPELRTAVTNTTFNRNYQGVVARQYNNPSNRRLELFHRHKQELIFFKDVKIYNSLQHTMFMPSVTKFTDDYVPTYEDMTRPERVATINYTIFQSEFRNNGRGILAEHNHVDFANNVYKWKVDHITLIGTLAGGLEVEVPRINDDLQPESHAVVVVDSNFLNNYDFVFTVAGYYTQVHVDRNVFSSNKCLLGLISVTGMEKLMTMGSNLITDNVCRYMIDIDISSHSEFFKSEIGVLSLNDISSNRYEGQLPPGSDNSPKTYAVAVRGVQNIQANRNLFRNPTLEYELVAGITSILLGSSVNVTLNYWGYTDQSSIRARIFDFDDWNNFAIAEYYPYLSIADRNSTPTTGTREEIYLDPDHLGGRVEKSQILMEIGRPYIVQSDLTVMPGVTLTIPPGTELQLYPDVGILVLGRLVANGLPYSRIKFLPVQGSNYAKSKARQKRAVETSSRERRQSPIQTLRLRGDGSLFKDAGFLELYNTTTKTWNLMCDSQFHEKTAEVVCRELGKEVINVKVRMTYLYDFYIYGKPMYSLKQFWYYSYFCRGDETFLSQCTTRYNYNLLDCVYAANYTFITCGARNLDPSLNYWGNIRFAMDAYQEQPLEADLGKDRSSLSYVDIVGAGMLHGDKVGAIQATYVTPFFSYINISNCAENGYDIIAPRQDLNVKFQNITTNLGFGINVLVLNGESSDRTSSFQPSGPSTIPYSVHGLVDMCRLEKEINVDTRLILYYKYGPLNRDCVKIIRSKRTVGLRFLQVNLFQEDFSRNSVEIFDGEIASNSSHIGHIIANTSLADLQKLYRTTGSVMAVHIHASVSFGSYGFVAEVVRLPLAGLTYPNSDYSHLIQQSEIRKNEDGAIQYKNVGETTPSLFIEHCWLGENGYPILNLTSPPTIDISLQSTITFRFSFNQVTYNYGGMYLHTSTSALNTALKGNLTNNVFAFGRNGEALNISGHYFQRLMLFQNYFYNYTAGDYRDVIHVKSVTTNWTHNYIIKNVGHYIIHTYSNDVGGESQLFSRNGIISNNATALRESTIKVGIGAPKFVNNFFYNPLNDYEMASFPKAMSDVLSIDAKNNWWGSEREAYINGKTYDSPDDNSLVEIEFIPQILDNRSLVDGDCQPGWVLDNKRCYRYMGGALPFEQARQFCQSHGAFLAEGRDREDFFNYLIRLMVIEPDWSQRVWIMSDVGAGRCSALEKSLIVYEVECNRRYYPFICETDPQVAASSELLSAVQALIIGICCGVGGVILIILIVIIILWCVKSKRREKERFERTASIRSSLSNMAKSGGSLRGAKSTITVLSDDATRQKMSDGDEKSIVSSYSRSSQRTAGSNGIHRLDRNTAARLRGNPASVSVLDRSVDHRENANNSRYQRGDNATSKYPSNTVVDVTSTRRDIPRPGHSLRPPRPGTGPVHPGISTDTARETRTEGGQERNNKVQSPLNDAVDSTVAVQVTNVDEGVDPEESFMSDSTFDDISEDDESSRTTSQDIDANNMQFNIDRSNDQLFLKPGIPVKSGIDSLLRQQPKGDNVQPKINTTPYSFQSRDDLPTPPPDPRSVPFLQELTRQLSKPAPPPKPLPPPKTKSLGSREHLSAFSDALDTESTASFAVASPLKNSTNNLSVSDKTYMNQPGGLPLPDRYNHVYNNEQKIERLEANPVLHSSSHFYNNFKDSDQESNVNSLRDAIYSNLGVAGNQNSSSYYPVHKTTPSHHSLSNSYEPVNYDLSHQTPNGVDQQPDLDYLSQTQSTSSLRQGRFQPSAPSPSSRNLNESSPSDFSLMPSVHSDVDYIPRQFNPNINNKISNTLSRRSQENLSSSNEMSLSPSNNSITFHHPPYSPPPYSPEPVFQSASSHSRQTPHPDSSSSSYNLHEESQPYSLDDELMPRRHGGQRDVLYLPQAQRTRHNQSYETEI